MARPLGDEPAHGTRKRYQLRRDPCRCKPCRLANAEFIARRRGLRTLIGTKPEWTTQTLPEEFLPRCTHVLMSSRSVCSWCGLAIEPIEREEFRAVS
ncbi:MAG: hypothetical protein JWN99_2556 [Ilumatobacteraceae bacterium]|nr:hypothetical protein [Ilumatobacteraceae bacterium]